jgi:prevent-host-death family protein
MQTVSLFNAKTHLSGLVEQIASGAETEITIARHGQPVARLVPVSPIDAAKRIGIAAGQFDVPDDIDAHNQEILDMMSGT